MARKENKEKKIKPRPEPELFFSIPAPDDAGQTRLNGCRMEKAGILMPVLEALYHLSPGGLLVPQKHGEMEQKIRALIDELVMIL